MTPHRLSGAIHTHEGICVRVDVTLAYCPHPTLVVFESSPRQYEALAKSMCSFLDAWML